MDELRLNAFDKVRQEYILSLKEASDFIAANLTVYINMLIYISIVLLAVLLVCIFSLVCTDSEDCYLKPSCVAYQPQNSWGSYLAWSNSAAQIILMSTFLGSFSCFVLCMTHAGVVIPTSAMLFYSFAILTFLCFSVILFCTARVVLMALPRRLVRKISLTVYVTNMNT